MPGRILSNLAASSRQSCFCVSSPSSPVRESSFRMTRFVNLEERAAVSHHLRSHEPGVDNITLAMTLPGLLDSVGSLASHELAGRQELDELGHGVFVVSGGQQSAGRTPTARSGTQANNAALSATAGWPTQTFWARHLVSLVR